MCARGERFGQALAAVLLSLGGCSRAPIEIELPDAEQDPLVIALLDGDTVIDIGTFSTENNSGHLPAIAVHDARPLDVVVLRYAPGLLRTFPLGRLEINTSGVALPKPIATRTARVEGGAVGPWTTLDTLPPPLARVRVVGRPPACPEIELLHSAPLRSTDDVTFLLPYGDGVLAGTDDGHLYTVDTDGLVARLETDREFSLGNAAIDDDGQLWLFGHDGEVWAANITGLEVTTSTHTPQPRGEKINWAVARGSGVDVELFVMLRRGEVSRYKRGAWRTMFDFGMNLNKQERGDLFVDGEAVWAAWANSKLTARIVGDQVETSGPSAEDNGLTTVTVDPVRGPITASAWSQLYRQIDGRWLPIPNSSHGLLVNAIVPFANGLLIAGLNGNVAYYNETLGLCPAEQLVSSEELHHIVVRGDVAFLAGEENNEFTTVGVVRVVHR